VTFPKWNVDDSYISYRYAENLALHNELTWNVGEPKVDGNTGLAWPILLACFIKLGFSPIFVSHVLGVVSFFLGEIMLLLILRSFKLSKISQSTGLLFYSFFPLLFTHALSGMETVLFVGSILAALYLVTRVIAAPNNYPLEAVFVVWLLFLSLIRPEGVVLSGLCLMTVFYHFSRGRAAGWLKHSSLLVFGYGVPLILYGYWQFNYFGQLLPNTFYIKAVSGFTTNYVADIFRFSLRFFLAPLGVCLILALLETDSFWKNFKAEKDGLPVKIFMSIFTILFIYVLFNLALFTRAHLSVNFSYRFYLPLITFFWVVLPFLFDWGMGELAQSNLERPLRYKTVLATIILLGMYQTAYYIKILIDERQFANSQISLQENEHNAIGKFLKMKIPSTEWLAVYIDAGAMPYFSKLKTIDMGGLNDELLARKYHTLPERINYLFSFNPAAIVFTSNDEKSVVYDEGAAAIISDARFNNYELYKVFSAPNLPAPAYEFLYLRKNLKILTTP
jgi:hypothetical protein